MNEHYREAHGVAWLILDGLGIQDIFDGSSHRCFAFLLDMNRLFENFVTRWLGGFLRKAGYRVLPQRRDRTILWNPDLGCPHSSVIPDILIERVGHAGHTLPLDAKYKLYDQVCVRQTPSTIRPAGLSDCWHEEHYASSGQRPAS